MSRRIQHASPQALTRALGTAVGDGERRIVERA